MKRLIICLFLAVLVLCGCANEETNTEIKVAIIDTGISSQAIPSEYVSEGQNYLIPDGTTEDTFGHGTAVASVILENSSDVVLVPLVSNVYDSGKVSFVDSATFAQMIKDAVDIYNCDIINISAGLVLNKQSVREAIEYVEEQGVLVVASAGNDYVENAGQIYYPAAYDTVLAVGALDASGTEIASFSQRGEWVDIFALGEDVEVKTLSGGSSKEKGSSYAAARVTAAAVGYLQMESNLSPEELRTLLIENTESYGAKVNPERR